MTSLTKERGNSSFSEMLWIGLEERKVRLQGISCKKAIARSSQLTWRTQEVNKILASLCCHLGRHERGLRDFAATQENTELRGSKDSHARAQ